MNPFDQSFILTIPRNLARCKATMGHLATHGLEPTVFLGIDGFKSGLSTIHTYERDNPGTDFKIGQITVSLYLGHYMIWKTCSHMEHDTTLIFEDDVRLHPDYCQQARDALAHLPPDWDILFLGSCCCANRNPVRVHGRLHKITYALCNHAYVVRKNALPIMLEACEKIYTAVDIAMCLEALPKLNAFAVLPRIANQNGTVLPD